MLNTKKVWSVHPCWLQAYLTKFISQDLVHCRKIPITTRLNDAEFSIVAMCVSSDLSSTARFLIPGLHGCSEENANNVVPTI